MSCPRDDCDQLAGSDPLGLRSLRGLALESDWTHGAESRRLGPHEGTAGWQVTQGLEGEQGGAFEHGVGQGRGESVEADLGANSPTQPGQERGQSR